MKNPGNSPSIDDPRGMSRAIGGAVVGAGFAVFLAVRYGAHNVGLTPLVSVRTHQWVLVLFSWLGDTGVVFSYVPYPAIVGLVIGLMATSGGSSN